MVTKGDKIIVKSDELKELTAELDQNCNRKQNRLNISKDNAEQGLVKLVLTVVELIRRLLEKQALLRLENESLTEKQIEQLGEALYKLEETMKELKVQFGLVDDDLNINLGPLGNLM